MSAARRIRVAGEQFKSFDRPQAERIHVAMAIRKGHPVRLPAGAEPDLRVRGDGHNGWTTLVPYVNEGRWVVTCPACREGQVVDPDDPRFYCYLCNNSDHGGGWIRLHFPKAEVRELIADVLAERHEANAGWLPHETVGDLADENEVHRLRVPATARLRGELGVGLPPADLDRVVRAHLKNPREHVVVI